MTVAIGLGMITALNVYPNVFLALKLASAAYVFWLAWKLIRAGRFDGQAEAKPATFWDGVILLLLNPKAYISMALMFSQFLITDRGLQIANVMTISTNFTLNNFVAFSIWTPVGDKIADRFRTDEGARRLNLMFGLLLAAVAVWMLFS